MKVQLKKRNSKYHDLTVGNVYRVIGIEADDYRLMNDVGRPYLYPASLFRIVDACEPADWRSWYGEGGERYSYPPEIAHPGFFEDYFDDDPRAMATLHQYLSAAVENRRKVS